MTSPAENLLGSFVTFFDHGLLMIEDTEGTAVHRGWDARTEYIHFDENSLYVAVQSVVDGPVAVAAYRGIPASSEVEGMVEAFSGEFDLKHGRLKLHDSDDRAVLTVLAKPGINRVAVFVDELNWASRVAVAIGV